MVGPCAKRRGGCSARKNKSSTDWLGCVSGNGRVCRGRAGIARPKRLSTNFW